MRKIIFTITLLFTLTSFSQKGKVVYIATFNFESFYESKGEIDNNTKDIEYKKNTDDIECILTFNKNESLFKKNEYLEKDNSKFNMTNIKVGNGLFYYNRKDGITIEEKKAFGEIFLITKDTIKWNFTTETKIISGYKSKKATAFYKFKDAKGIERKRKIIAWYTPEIPISFGPKNYNGLPGLIVSLQEGNLFYIATKIVLNTKEDTIIIKPTKGKIITQKKYTKMLREFLFKRKRM